MRHYVRAFGPEAGRWQVSEPAAVAALSLDMPFRFQSSTLIYRELVPLLTFCPTCRCDFCVVELGSSGVGASVLHRIWEFGGTRID